MQEDQFARIRGLISDLELCHHKAARRVELIIRAIGEGRTSKDGSFGLRQAQADPESCRRLQPPLQQMPEQ